MSQSEASAPATRTSAIAFGYGFMVLSWGSTWIMIKVGLDGAPPLGALTLRFMLAAIILAGVIAARGIAIPRTRHFLFLSLFLGAIHQAAGYMLVYWGEQFIDSGLTAILYSTMPFAVAILSRIILGTPLTFPKIAGIAAGVCGVWLIFSDTPGMPGHGAVRGVTAILASVFCASLCSVVIKRHANQYHPFVMLLAPVCVGAVIVGSVSAIVEKPNPLTFTLSAWGTIAYLAVIGTVAAFSVFYWVVKRIDVTAVSYQTFIIPLVAMFLGWVFLGETISARAGAGTCVILAGIVTATIGSRHWERRRRK